MTEQQAGGATLSRLHISLSRQLALLAVLFIVLAGVALAVYSQQPNAGGVRVFALGAVTACAAAPIAAVVGFIFGLPRYSNTPVVTVPSGTPEGETTAAARAVNATSGLLTPSNNLEQVADWLTKLLIGAGLVQLGAIGTWIGSFINDLAVAFSASDGPPPEAAKIVAGSILGFSVSIGFVFGYLLTTLWYQRRLDRTLQPD
jgi:hypothetical protein